MTDVRGPDGRIVRFPDGTDQATIMRVMGEIYNGQKPDDSKGLNGSVTDTSPAQGPAPDGMIGSGVRALANGLTAGFADKAAAGLEAVIPGIGNAGTQTIWQGHSLGDAYAHNKGVELAQTKADEAAHPWISGAGNGAGAVGLGLGTAGLGEAAGLGNLAQMGTAGKVAAAVAPDVAYGAAYGAGQSNADSYGGQAMDALKGGAGGLAGHALGAGLGKVVSGVTDPVLQDLAARGVKFTPGQMMGGIAQGIEQKLSSIPFAGDAIKARLAESGSGWQNATLNRALQNIGDQIPEGKTGTDAMAYAGKAFDNAYDAARSGMQFQKTPEFEQAVNALTDRVQNGGVDSLSDTYRAKFDNVLKNTVERRMPDGTMDGDTYKLVVSDLKKAASKAMSGVDTEGKEYGSALMDLAGIIDEAARQSSSPEAVAALNRADQGYGLLALAQKAADRGSSQAPGIVTPQKYLAAVESGDNTARNRAFSEGRAFDQQWGMNGLQALGKSIPNSFTADRSLLAALTETALAPGAGHAIAGLGAPVAGAAVGVGLPAAALGGSLLYSRPVNAFLNRAAFGGGAARAQVGKVLNPLLRAGGTGAGATLAVQHATP